MRSLFLPFLLLSLAGTAQTDNRIVLGTIDSLQSTILNEQRKVWVYLPEGAKDNLSARQRYPVVYLLDGDAHFYSVVGMIQQLSSVNGNTICPEMIVVGIPNTDRTRDLTPTHVAVDLPYMDSSGSKTSGGGEKFIGFIEKELMPHIDSLYPTAPYRVLIGHSFGGLTAINAFVHHTKLFNAYVAIDPSMWWDNKKLLNQCRQALSGNVYPGTALFLGIANTMNEGMDTTQAQRDTSVNTKHIRSILALNQYFRMNRQNKLKYQSRYYNDDDHGSVPLITAYDALHFLFSYYKLKLTFDDYVNLNTAVIKKIEKHYEEVSAQLSYTVKIPENTANSFGYQAMNLKHYEAAEYLFKLNITNYPGSSNTYDSLGDLCAAKGDKINAVTNFKKALAIKDSPETRAKLERLQGNK